MTTENRNAVANIDPRAATLRDLIAKNYKAMSSVLPTHITPERMARVSLNAVTAIPKLLECNPSTFINAMLECAVLGLEPGVAGQCWIVPYKGKATLVVGYKGMIQLAWRSAQIATIGAEPVYERDAFEYDKYPPRLVHKPHRGEDRGRLVAAYAYAKLQNGGEMWVVMEDYEILAIKKRSAAVKSGADTPWTSPEDEHTMWTKTVLRKLMKFLPMSVEVQRAVENDERADAGLTQKFDFELDPDKEVSQGSAELNKAVREAANGGGNGSPDMAEIEATSKALYTQYEKQIDAAKTLAALDKIASDAKRNESKLLPEHFELLAQLIEGQREAMA